MISRSRHLSATNTTVAAATVLFSALASAAGPYESVGPLRAADVLPTALQASDTHRVSDEVANDGFMNRYEINSRFGSLQAHSTAELRKRVTELAAAQELEALSKTDEFGKHLAGGAERVVSGAQSLIISPVQTVTGALSGVGKMFENANESIFGVGSGDEDQLKALLGFNEKKREYASAFGVDAYSRNPHLQKVLEDVAWAGFAGGITTTMAGLAVSGGVGAALSVSTGAELLNREQMNLPPVELRKRNQGLLLAMGVSEDVAGLFLDNTNFTLTQATLFVNALVAVEGASGRDAVVKLAVNSSSAQIADFRRRQAQLYAAVHKERRPIGRFSVSGQMVGATAVMGERLFALPVDHLLWTEGLDSLSQMMAKESGDARQLWIGGDATESAVAQLEAAGWTVHTRADAVLLDVKL